MAIKWLLPGVVSLLLLAGACARKQVQAPPPPPVPAKQNVFALLPEPEGASSGIVVKNQAGSQDLTQPNQAVRVDRPDLAPSAPFALDQAEVRRLFGAAIDALPAPEIQFVLHFDENRDVLNAESDGMMPAILTAIRDRHSTAITVTGHTDTTADHQFNYQLGLRRAQRVAAILQSQGVNASDVFVSSHGDADLLVPTGPNVAEARNRRVEVIVR
jgi:outer membrane protein OmpA-like peptidoglycan-associated protein